jgi:glycosyltransferase involved in cell wall biosynthesis
MSFKVYRKKILFLIPSLVGGGAERALLNILAQFENEGAYEITLCVVANVGTYLNQVPAKVKVVPLFSNNNAVRILAFLQKKLGFTYLFERKIRNKLTDHYDVAISFLDGNFTDLLFFIPHAKKTVSWVHSSYVTNKNFYKFYQNKNYKDFVKKNRYDKLDSIVFVSQDAKNEFITLFGAFKEMPVIYNFLDEKAVYEKAKTPTEHDSHTCMLFVAIGSYLPVKGYDKLIAAAAILKSEHIDFKIHIYGQGYLKQTLQQQIIKANIEDKVLLKGFVNNPYPYILAADVFVMTSVSEAMPMALCEAMILGKPTLVTNCSGCREVVGYGEFGMMVNQTPEAIAEGMKLYIEKETIKVEYAEKSHERANDFKDDVIIKKIKKIIQE